MTPRGRLLIDEVEQSVVELCSDETVELLGEWSPRSRRTYRSASQHGSGSGPYVDVVDYRWEGHASFGTPCAAIAFAATKSKLYWVKSPPPATTLSVCIGMTAYPHQNVSRCTLSFALSGSFLPAFPAAVTTVPPGLGFSTGVHRTGTALTMLRADEVEFVALFLPGRLVAVGRNRLWHLRAQHAASLPERVRRLLTRHRAGRFDVDAAASQEGA